MEKDQQQPAGKEQAFKDASPESMGGAKKAQEAERVKGLDEPNQGNSENNDRTPENNEKKLADRDSSSEAALERGKKAAEADEKINKKDPDDPKVKEGKAKDAEKWRNEG